MYRETRKNTSTHFGAALHMATVISCDPGTMSVTVAPDGQGNLARIQGIPLASTFAHALGFKEPVLPQVGSRVLCFGGYSGATLIVGTVPPGEIQGDSTQAAMPSRASFGTDEPLLDGTHAPGYNVGLHKAGVFNNQLPTDVVQGEKVIQNEFGVMLGLFQLMGVLKGSELAQVQCHFLDDLVRVISHNFQHYHALGEFDIFHDGKGLHMETGLTHDPKEALGVAQPGSSSAPVNTLKDTGKSTNASVDPVTGGYVSGEDFYDITKEQLKAVERLKLFVGKLGDFINLLLVLPGAEPRALDGTVPTDPDKGLLQVHAGLDGLLIVRSVKGIVLEKTNWIRVPTRIRTPEDPTGDDGATVNYKLREAFGFDDTYKDSGTPFLYYLQLKDYLAQVEEGLNYSNFSAHAKDFFVNGEYTQEKPLQAITYVDPITGASFQKKRSIVALMPNGGLSLSDAWGSAINMEGGNIYIQPAKDLVLQPLGNIIAKVGENVSVAARGDIDLSSTLRGLRIKTNLAQYLYSDTSGIILHANGPALPNGVAPYDNKTQPVDYVGGVLITSPNAGVTTYGKQVYSYGTSVNTCRGQELKLFGDTAAEILSQDIVLNAQDIQLFAGSTKAPANCNITAYSQGSALFIGANSTVIGLKGQNFGIVYEMGMPIGAAQGLLDPNDDKQKDFFIQLNKDINLFDKMKPGDSLISFAKDETFSKVKFLFPPTSYYGLVPTDVIPQTVVQLEDATFTGLYALDKWAETPVNGTYPYPGADHRMCLVTTTLKNVTKQSNGELVNKTTGLVANSALSAPIDIFTEYKVNA